MSSPLLTTDAVAVCPHGGRVVPVALGSRVLVAGLPTVRVADPCPVTGCQNPPTLGGPCTTAAWAVGAARVLVGGVPVVLADSPAVCQPTGDAATVVLTQTRVLGR